MIKIKNKTVNILWIRHGLSCSNILTSILKQKHNCSNVSKIKKKIYKKMDNYPRDSKLTNIGKKHCKTIGKKLPKIDKIITSQLLRAMYTGFELSKSIKNLNDKSIHISPFIQELKIKSDGKSGRTLKEIDNYVNDISKIKNIYLIGKENEYNKYCNLNQFIKILTKFVLKINKKNITILVVTHGGFLDKYITNKKIANLEVWKQKINFIDNKISNIEEAELYKKGIGSRNKEYYCDVKNYGLNNLIFNKTKKECNFDNLN